MNERNCEFTRSADSITCSVCGFTRPWSASCKDLPKQNCFPEAVIIPTKQHVGSRGLGDTIAKVIDVATLGLARRILPGCMGCNGRIAWLNQWWPYEPAILTEVENPRILLRFPHGFGDAVQLTTVLLHLRAIHPNWQVDVAGKVGAINMYRDLCRNIYLIGQEPPESEYDVARTLSWYEPTDTYSDSPGTKAEKSLREVFKIHPRPDLCRYSVAISDRDWTIAGEFLDKICRDAGVSHSASGRDRRPVVMVHYQGNTSRANKDLNEQHVATLCRRLRQWGYVPLIPDLHTPSRSGLFNEGIAFNCGVDEPLWGNTGTGDASAFAALIGQCTLMVGVDSGPLHVAGATSTPTLAVWRKHHPVNYFGLCQNVRHLVPINHGEYLIGDRGQGERFFEGHYDYSTYCRLQNSLVGTVREMLDQIEGRPPTGLMLDCGVFVRRSHRHGDTVVARDVYAEDSYKIGEITEPIRRAIDVGAHIGCFSALLRRLWPDCKITCIEANEGNLAALGVNAGPQATVIHAAATYQAGPLLLLDTLWDSHGNTGGSSIISADEPWVAARSNAHEYMAAEAPQAITIEAAAGEGEIDLLKLDCEGCEFSILENCDLSRIKRIVGEWHDRERFMQLVADRFAPIGWSLRILKDGQLGTFWLTRPETPVTIEPMNSQPIAVPDDPRDRIYTVDDFGGWGNAFHFCTPAGIGDISWVYSKLRYLKAMSGMEVILSVAGQDVPRRGEDFVKLLPEVRWGGYLDDRNSWQVLSQCLPSNWPDTMGGWEVFAKPWLQNVSANMHLESGKSLADFWPKLPTDYHYPIDIPQGQRDRAMKEFMAFTTRPAVGVYVSGSDKDKIKRGGWGLWSVDDWLNVLLKCSWAANDMKGRQDERTSFVLLGAEYDRDKTEELARRLRFEHGFTVIEVIGQPLGVALACLENCQFCFSYPSGLGILANVLRVPAIMLLPRVLGDLGSYADPFDIAAWKYKTMVCPTPTEAINWFSQVAIHHAEWWRR